MATIKDLPTHPLFSHTKTSKKLRSSASSYLQAPLLSPEVPLLSSEAPLLSSQAPPPSSQAPSPSLQAPLPFSQAPLSSLQSSQAPFVLLPQGLSQGLPQGLPPTPFVLPSQNNWTYGPLAFQPFSLPFNPYQVQSQFISLQPNASRFVSTTLPTMDEFLRDVDEQEGTGHYYQNFLYELRKQEVSVKNLKTLSDEAFKDCGVKTIGARQTLRDYAGRF